MNKLDIIAIHGAGMTGAVWAGLPVRALTLPGHGGGTPLKSIADMAEWVQAHIKEDCILLGHSMGALAAVGASSHPAVQGLVLLGAAATMPVHPDLLKQARENPAQAAQLILKWGVFSQDAAIKQNLTHIMQDGLGALAGDLAACDAWQGDEKAKAFKKPVLVIAGAEDKMVKPKAAEAFADLFPQGRYISLPDTGHMAMAENPPGTIAALQSFLSEVSGR